MSEQGVPISDRNASHIPIEIIDEILDYLRSDNSCLRNCALISKSWTPSCRRHLFSRVDLESPADFTAWSRSIPAVPNGPHQYTRELIITNRHFEGHHPSLGDPTAFFQHFILFCNIQDLTIGCSGMERMIDSISDASGHLFGSLRSLSVDGAFCSPQALISFVASFRQLERLDLDGIWFEASKIPRPLPEQHIFRGTLHFTDWNDTSEEFAGILAQCNLQYREMFVNGMRWLQNTTWNKCLAKCADRLETFCIRWYENECSYPTHFETHTFENLRSLTIESSSERRSILPPPEFLSSITSTYLSRIIIDVSVFPPGEELDEALDAIREYDRALCQLANQHDPSSSGSETLVLTLRVVEEFPDPAAVLPRFSESGTLKVVAMGL